MSPHFQFGRTGQLAIALAVLLAGGVAYWLSYQDQLLAHQFALDEARLKAEAGKARAAADHARHLADKARLDSDIAAGRRLRDGASAAAAAPHTTPVGVTETETLGQRYTRMKALPEVSQEAFNAKVMIRAFKVVSIEAEKFDIEVTYDYDAAVGPLFLRAMASSERYPSGNMGHVELKPSQSARVRVSVPLATGGPGSTSTMLTIDVSRSDGLRVKKVYPWTHKWPGTLISYD